MENDKLIPIRPDIDISKPPELGPRGTKRLNDLTEGIAARFMLGGLSREDALRYSQHMVAPYNTRDLDLDESYTALVVDDLVLRNTVFVEVVNQFRVEDDSGVSFNIPDEICEKYREDEANKGELGEISIFHHDPDIRSDFREIGQIARIGRLKVSLLSLESIIKIIEIILNSEFDLDIEYRQELEVDLAKFRSEHESLENQLLE